MTSPDFGAGKTEVFSPSGGKSKKSIKQYKAKNSLNQKAPDNTKLIICFKSKHRLPHSVPKGKASLNLKGPFGVTNLQVCSQKIVPIFLFFCLDRDPLGTCDKPTSPQRDKKTTARESFLREI
jgi:hypothetical protein